MCDGHVGASVTHACIPPESRRLCPCSTVAMFHRDYALPSQCTTVSACLFRRVSVHPCLCLTVPASTVSLFQFLCSTCTMYRRVSISPHLYPCLCFTTSVFQLSISSISIVSMFHCAYVHARVPLCPCFTMSMFHRVCRLVGQVVKASTSRAEDPGFESRLRRDFSGSSHTSDLKNWHSRGYPTRRLAS